jgi:hypothetical protein
MMSYKIKELSGLLKNENSLNNPSSPKISEKITSFKSLDENYENEKIIFNKNNIINKNNIDNNHYDDDDDDENEKKKVLVNIYL